MIVPDADTHLLLGYAFAMRAQSVRLSLPAMVVLQPGEMRSLAVYPKDSLLLTAESYHAPVALSPAEIHALPHVSAAVHNPHTDRDET